jgi:hypothetical protein
MSGMSESYRKQEEERMKKVFDEMFPPPTLAELEEERTGLIRSFYNGNWSVQRRIYELEDKIAKLKQQT